MKIYSYNESGSAPFSRACWLVSTTNSTRGWERHCHGINITDNPQPAYLMASRRQLAKALILYVYEILTRGSALGAGLAFGREGETVGPAR